LRPNYNKTCVQVYTDTAIYLLRTHNPFDLLQRVPWTLPQNGGHGGTTGLPSWVPDWSRRQAVPRLPTNSYSASGDTTPCFRIYENEHILGIKGKLLARLDNLMEPDIIIRNDQQSDEDILSRLKSTLEYKKKWYHYCTSACGRLAGQMTPTDLSRLSTQDRYPTGELLRDAFWRTLVCNIDMQGRKVGPEYGEYWQLVHHFYCRGLEALATRLSAADISAMMSFEEPMSMFSEGRKFCTTSNGYMGWAPQQAKLGDIVCIFKGSTVPFLLREAIFKDPRSLPFLVRPFARYFQLVGECYVHGFMEGEYMKDQSLECVEIMLC
jgi:hypothetical protein